MDILEELWLGQISPIEEAAPKSEEYRKALNRITQCQQSLEALLPQEGKQDLLRYSDAEIQVQDYAERIAFAKGFRLGAKFMLAVQEEK